MNTKSLEEILNDYVERVVPKLVENNYHLRLVKGGPKYPHLSEQSHFAHIVNGVFGLSQLVRFITERSIKLPRLNENTLRKALAAYTIHDLHKDASERLGTSEFSIPIPRIREEYEKLGLSQLAVLDEHLMRAANVHKRSSKHGDLLLSDAPDEASFIWTLVRIADVLASAQEPAEAAASLGEHLADLSMVFSRGIGQYNLYYHTLIDVRGVLTNAIHEAVALQLSQQAELYPLLFFATGTLYIGSASAKVDPDKLVRSVVDQILRLIASEDKDAIRDGLRPQKYDFERYVYTFASVKDLVEVVYEDTLSVRNFGKTARQEVDEMSKGRTNLPANWRQTVEERLGISLLDSREHRLFNERWSAVRRYLLFVDSIVRDLSPTTNRLDWLLETFNVPKGYAQNLREQLDIWARGGIGKYVLPVAFHFLRGEDFADRSAEECSLEEVLKRLHERVSSALEKLDTDSGRERVLDELGLREDLESYLRERLVLSLVPTTQLQDDGLAEYVKPKGVGHTNKLCSLCNRYSEYVQEIRTGVLDDFGRVFSNRVLPRREAPQGNRLWCPVCQLEAVLRKTFGMSLPRGAHYKKSLRINLFVLPTFSFTSEHVRLFSSMLHPFQQVTSLPIRDYGQDNPGLPRRWLEHRKFDLRWIQDLKEVLIREANRLGEMGGRNFVGERVVASEIKGQPHYYLISWEKAARESESDDARIATRTEGWSKALFAASLISGLTACKVFITERSHLPTTNPAELRATITLDSPPPALRALLGRGNSITLYGVENKERSGLEAVIDISASLWIVTAEVRSAQRTTKDKHISARLAQVNTSPLAGASFYKEFGRLNDGSSPPPILAAACVTLLQTFGGEWMDLVQKIAESSLSIALPSGAAGRGKARRYELIFREAVAAMHKAQKVIPGVRRAVLTGTIPAKEDIDELKRLTAGTLLKGLERRRENQRGDVVVRAWGDELVAKVGEFVDLIVDELYIRRAKGNFAQFLQLENALADGIYYYTDCNLSRHWEEFKIRREADKAKLASS